MIPGPPPPPFFTKQTKLIQVIMILWAGTYTARAYIIDYISNHKKNHKAAKYIVYMTKMFTTHKKCTKLELLHNYVMTIS